MAHLVIFTVLLINVVIFWISTPQFWQKHLQTWCVKIHLLVMETGISASALHTQETHMKSLHIKYSRTQV